MANYFDLSEEDKRLLEEREAELARQLEQAQMESDSVMNNNSPTELAPTHPAYNPSLLVRPAQPSNILAGAEAQLRGITPVNQGLYSSPLEGALEVAAQEEAVAPYVDPQALPVAENILIDQGEAKKEFQHTNRDYGNGEIALRSLIGIGLTFLGARALGYDAGEAMGAGMITGMHTFGNDLNKKARYQNIDALSKSGYTQESIEDYINSGDSKSLKEMKVDEWKAVGDGKGTMWKPDGKGGIVFQENTSYKAKRDTATVDGSLWERQDDNSWAKVIQGAPKSSGGGTSDWGMSGGVVYNKRTGEIRNASGGVDEASEEDYKVHRDPNTKMIMKPKFDKNGRFTNYIPASKAEATMFTEANAARSTMNEQQALVEKDLKTLSNADPKNIDTLTGKSAFGGLATDAIAGFRSTVMGDDTLRNITKAGERLNASMTNAAIAAAKAAGSSGINTLAEVEQYSKNMPKLDYSSQESYNRSLADLQEYHNNFMNRMRSAMGDDEPQEASGDDVLDGYM